MDRNRSKSIGVRLLHYGGDLGTLLAFLLRLLIEEHTTELTLEPTGLAAGTGSFRYTAEASGLPDQRPASPSYSSS